MSGYATNGVDRSEQDAVNRFNPRASRIQGRALIGSADAMYVVDVLRELDRVSTVDELLTKTGFEKGHFERTLRLLAEGELLQVSAGQVRLSNASDGCVLAVDIGGTKVRAALADLHGNLIRDLTVPTAGDSIITLVAELHAGLRDAGLNVSPMRGACIGIPASYDPGADRAWNCANLTALRDIRPAEAFSRALGIPVVVAQDVRLAVVGERWRGWGRGQDDFVVICLGTGVAMGIVVNGELYAGGRGAAGEISLLPFGTDPFDPLHQRRGPFEDFVSGPSFRARWMRAQGLGLDEGPMNAAEIFAAARRGDPRAQAELQEEGRAMALGIVSVIGTLDPSIVVLGGGLGSNPELFEPVVSNLKRLMPNAPPLRVSKLREDGPLFGAVAAAAALAFRPARISDKPVER
jgi:predicted NBD/HSP70 family sugar kinase